MRTEYIASGEYYIAKSEKCQLKALLGSCVGVALFDREANVGGIIHFILPAPYDVSSKWKLEGYAESGLPFFIDKLVAKGADKQKLEAVIAGGALFGHISRQDINLDIGGRTIEKVMAVLRKYKINILREETSGFYPSVLMLDTYSWQAEIQTSFEIVRGHSPDPEKPTREQIEQTITEINPIPQAALKIIRLINSGEYHLNEVADTLMTDQVLGAKVISLCNSAMFGQRREIDSLQEALLILGEGYLIEMVVTASIESFINQHRGGYSLLRGGLYKHAVAVGSTARSIAKVCNKATQGTAYTAGLLHDIGKVVLDQYFSAFKPTFYRDISAFECDLTELEIEYLNIDHQQSGKLLATKWQLPESIVKVIEYHHYPLRQDDALAHIVYLADLLTCWFQAETEIERINADSLLPTLEKLGLKTEDLPLIVEKTPWHKIMYL